MKRDPSGYWESIGVKGEGPGHPFRGNQYTDGTEGQDRESYSDTQDRDNYTVDPELEKGDREQAVHDAIRTILSDKRSYNTSLNYAVNYAREALNMSGRELQVQVLYLLNNLSSWRHPEAAQVRQTLREFAKPKKR